jgi:hypothetical protein
LISAAERRDRRPEVRHFHLHIATDLVSELVAITPSQHAPSGEIVQRRYCHVVENRQRRENALGFAIARQKGDLRASSISLRPDRRIPRVHGACSQAARPGDAFEKRDLPVPFETADADNFAGIEIKVEGGPPLAH